MSSSKNYLLHNINFLMEASGITANVLSKETGVGQATIYKIKDGVISNPTIDTIYPISKYFGFSIDELVGVKLYSSTPSVSHVRNMIPLIPFHNIGDFANTAVMRYINTDFTDIEGKCCVEVLEDNCIFKKNGILILDLNTKYEKLDFVIVKRNNDSICSIKKVIFDDIFFLQSIVKTLEHQIFDINDYTILGVVVGYIKYFKEPR
ncbi:MAG: helix-turn-helix domain-containing protein [Burkholderiales bacterium]|nr:helix-turn-helix domain-containing protein [Burkholderiales bacterium]